MATGPEQAEIEVRVDLATLIRELARASATGGRGPASVVQTHLSVVFLAGDRAWKVKKPLRLWGFIDYGTVAARRRCCETEVRLNRRLAPDVYLGVTEVVRRPDGMLAFGGEGEVVEHAVEMARFPPGAEFAERLADGRLTPADLEDALDVLEAFHDAHRLARRDAALARPQAFARILAQNVEATRARVGDLFPPRMHAALEHRLARRLWTARDVLRRRLAAGRMVDGHGDIRLEHVLRWGARVEVVDCTEFSPRLRHLDPLSDLAFLPMELQVRGEDELAGVWLDRLRRDPDADLLLPLFLAYRAHVRAKVDAQTEASEGVEAERRADSALRARRHMALAAAHARDGTVGGIAIVHGPSGAGKSVLARRIAPWLRARIVQSDVVRKELAGLAPTDRVTGDDAEALYGADMSARTYAEVLRRGVEAARAGQAVLLDATWLRRDSRHEARRAAASIGAPFAVVDVRVSPETARARVRAREEVGGDASDADVRVLEEQLRTAEPLEPGEQTRTVRYAGGPPETLALDLLEVWETPGAPRS